jgi:hypothetical protein
MTRFHRILLAAISAVIAFAGASSANAGSITLSDPNCDSFNVVGPPGNQTLTCVVSSPPVCTVQGPSAGSIGTAIPLTAQCSPAATSWIWTGGSCANNTAQTCLANESASGNVSYTVQGSNAIAAGGVSNPLTVSWSSGPPPAPTGCVASIVTTPTTLTNAGGTANLSVAGCLPANVTYNWTKNVTAGWSTSANPPADSLPAGGTAGYTNTYTAQVCNGTTCITLPAKTAFVPGSGGGGGGTDLSACNAAGYTGKVIEVPYPLQTNNPRIWTATNANLGSFGNNDMIIVKFVAQSPEAIPGAQIQMGYQDTASNVTRLATLSTQPCVVATADFTPSSVLATSGGNQPIIRFTVDGNAVTGKPKLTKGATYYVNYVNRSDYNGQPTCFNGSCGAYIDFQAN